MVLCIYMLVSSCSVHVHVHCTCMCVFLQMWAARVALLVAMQQYREAEAELSPFGELVNPDLYYQYHSHNYPDKIGQCGDMYIHVHTASLSIISINLHVLPLPIMFADK